MEERSHNIKFYSFDWIKWQIVVKHLFSLHVGSI